MIQLKMILADGRLELSLLSQLTNKTNQIYIYQKKNQKDFVLFLLFMLHEQDTEPTSPTLCTTVNTKLLEFFVLATSKVISGQIPTYDIVHFYSVLLLF